MLARSKVMGPMFRLPFLYIVLVDFGRNGFVILTMILFLKKHSFSFIDEFILFYVLYVVTFFLCNALLLAAVRIGRLDKNETLVA